MSRPVLARILTALAAMLCLAAAASAQTAEKRIALVIGQGKYQNVAPLAHTTNDARLIADTLKGLGFRLIGDQAQTDLDKTGLEQAIRAFSKALPGTGAALFYYAGHGLQMQGANYLVPVNANPTSAADADFELVDVSLVLRQMDAAGARLNIVILDACRNNPFGGRGLRDVGSGLAQMKAPKGTLISYATQPGNVASDGSGEDSPYTTALAAAMRKPGQDVFQLFNEVGIAVDKTTNGAQQPWLASSPIEGDFYFSVPPASAKPATAAPAVVAMPTADREALFWESIKSSKDPADFQAYLKQYPKGTFAALAQNRLKELAHPPTTVAAATPTPPTATRSETAPQTAIVPPQPPAAAGAPLPGNQFGRVRGTIERLEGNRLLVRERSGVSLAIALKPETYVRAMTTSALEEVTVGDMVGVTGVQQPNGRYRAIELHVFPQGAKGPVGRFAWDLEPDSELINGHVREVKHLPRGELLTIALEHGHALAFVSQETPVVTWVRGERELLKPGAAVFIFTRKADGGGLETLNVAVERNGIKPPM